MVDRRAHEICMLVSREAKAALQEKLDGVYLFGSYARGDFDEESDVDIFVRIACTPSQLVQYREMFCPLASRLSLAYGVTVSVCVADKQSFDRYKNALAFYRNIEKEGVAIAG